MCWKLDKFENDPQLHLKFAQDDTSLNDALKEMSIFNIKPMIVQLILGDYVEIYLPEDQAKILLDHPVLKKLGIQSANSLKDLPFDRNEENNNCKEMGIDHGEYNHGFVNLMENRHGLLLNDVLKRMLELTNKDYINNTTNDFIVYRMCKFDVE